MRPFGDNGLVAEHWSENVLHPYAGNTSSLSDCLKLLLWEGPERRGIIIIGYEHTPPKIALETAVKSFEVLAREVLHLSLSARLEAFQNELIHPVHQQLRVYGFEVLLGVSQHQSDGPQP